MSSHRMCPHCRAFINAGERVCPYCNAEMSPRRRSATLRPRVSSGGWLANVEFATLVILLINFGLYLATAVFTVKLGGGFWDIDGRVLALFGSKYVPAIAAGQWWRLITAGFLHGGIFHIFMNSWALMSLGTQVESLYGTSRFLFLYFFATVAGFFASTLWSPANSIGASAGLFGLIGVMIALGVRTRGALGEEIKSQYIQWAVYGVVIGLLPGFAIDNAAHFGGFAAGFAGGWIAGLPSVIPTWRDRLWEVLGGICVLLTAISFLLMFLQLNAIRQG
ncbi:MAG: rhomboid family intramembrane serine protease [Acidobacteria bacterium]|nr:rhomboid family intramembrane serine protease [Acidobacteriota bacterium]